MTDRMVALTYMWSRDARWPRETARLVTEADLVETGKIVRSQGRLRIESRRMILAPR